VSEYIVDSTSEADEHARAIDTWWREHRPAAPDLFLAELARVLGLLASWPTLGVPYAHAAVPGGMRRLAMRSVKCHLYYTVDPARRLVLVRAIWHSSRGRGPF